MEMADPSSEMPLALAIMVVIAVPSIIMFCFILEEAPLKAQSGRGETFEDLPFFFGLSANQCCDSPATASLFCFFVVVVGLFLFASMGTLWFAVWGGMISRGSGFKMSETMNTGWSLLQGPHHSLAAFGQAVEIPRAAAAGPLPRSVALLGKSAGRAVLRKEPWHYRRNWQKDLLADEQPMTGHPAQDLQGLKEFHEDFTRDENSEYNAFSAGRSEYSDLHKEAAHLRGGAGYGAGGGAGAGADRFGVKKDWAKDLVDDDQPDQHKGGKWGKGVESDEEAAAAERLRKELENPFRERKDWQKDLLDDEQPRIDHPGQSLQGSKEFHEDYTQDENSEYNEFSARRGQAVASKKKKEAAKYRRMVPPPQAVDDDDNLMWDAPDHPRNRHVAIGQRKNGP